MKILQAQYELSRSITYREIPQLKLEQILKNQLYQALALDMINSEFPVITKETSYNPEIEATFTAKCFLLEKKELDKLHNILDLMHLLLPHEYKHLVNKAKELL